MTKGSSRLHELARPKCRGHFQGKSRDFGRSFGAFSTRDVESRSQERLNPSLNLKYQFRGLFRSWRVSAVNALMREMKRANETEWFERREESFREAEKNVKSRGRVRGGEGCERDAMMRIGRGMRSARFRLVRPEIFRPSSPLSRRYDTPQRANNRVFNRQLPLSQNPSSGIFSRS